MIVRALVSRDVLLTAVAVALLAGISVARLEVGNAGIMLFAAIPITLLAVMYGVLGGLASAAVASGVFLGWAFTQGHPGAVEEIDEPVVFFLLGLVAGIYAHGALGYLDPRSAVQRAELRRAIRRGEVVFHYQPLAEARTRHVVGLEALARWEHPSRGQIAPAGFIPIAERDERTIWDLTLLALDRALADLSTWGEAAKDVTISVNLSSLSLGRRDLATTFSSLLERHGVAPTRLAIEITETAVVGLPRRAVAALDSLKQLGVTIVLDDFGTGQSSLARLGSLPFDTLKLDLHLLPGAVETDRVLEAMIGLAHALGLRTVAERVEDDDTWALVSQMGCDLIQGFRLSPPLPADEVRDWLEHPSHSSLSEQP